MDIRICSYNIEWFDKLFRKNNQLRTGVREASRLEAIKSVLTTLDADFIGILEAPNSSSDGTRSTIQCLENFSAFAGLRARKAVTGFISGGRQEIAALFDPDVLHAHHSPGGEEGSTTHPPFNGEFVHDTDEDRIKEVYRHYRPPLELLIEVPATGYSFKLMAVHPKSKGSFSSMDLFQWIRESKRNRLKLFAECEWIRVRVDQWIDQGYKVVVMGDVNDGPGMDYYEFKYGKSAVEIIMGDIFHPEKILINFAGRPKWTSMGWAPSSTQFKDMITEKTVRVMIDHILVSRDVAVSGEQSCKVWNPYEMDDAKPIKDQLLASSDHFPITLDMVV